MFSYFPSNFGIYQSQCEFGGSLYFFSQIFLLILLVKRKYNTVTMSLGIIKLYQYVMVGCRPVENNTYNLRFFLYLFYI